MQKLAHGLMLMMAGTWAATLPAAEWRQEVVDQDGGGKFSSVRIDSYGNAHVSYVDDVQHQLRYAFWDHSLNKWFTTTLDKSRGFCSLVLDTKQRPHISYTGYGDGQLSYAYWDGASWVKEPIRIHARDISFYTSIVLDAKDNPRISYYEYWGTGEEYLLHLRNVVRNGEFEKQGSSVSGFWEVSTIDSTPGSGKFNSMASDSAGNPHIAYANVKDENASLRYARWNGRSWDIEVLEGREKPFYVYSVNMALDRDDNPHITYTDMTTKLVKYATRRDGKWQIQVVDSLAQVAFPDRNGIAVDAQGRPYISYYDAGRGTLKVATRRNQRWVAAIVEQNFAGFTSSIQIDHADIWLTYADETGGGLKCSRTSLAQFAQEVEDRAAPPSK